MDDLSEWDLQGASSNINDYVQQINQQLMQEKAEEQKKSGGSSLIAAANLGLISSKTVHLFTTTKFYKQVLAAQEYLVQNETKLKGWLNLVMIKELLLVKIEIDLNYIDLSPHNLEIFGWKIDQPLIINLEINELRLLNSFIE